MFLRWLVPTLTLVLIPGAVSAQTLSASAIYKDARFNESRQTRSPMADWQQQYDAATAKKQLGKKKIFIGLGAVVGGALITTSGAGGTCTATTTTTVSCDLGGHAKLGALVGIAGSGVFIWGVLDFYEANSEMSRLSSTKPKSPAPAFALTDHQALELTAGRRSSVAYRLSW